MKKLYNSPYPGFIPLIILIVYAVMLVIARINNETIFRAEHAWALTLLALPIAAFFIRYKLGIVVLGVVMLIGVTGLISLTPVVRSWALLFGGVTVIKLQPSFFLWALLHFLLSGKHYYGVIKEEYWRDVFQNGYWGTRKEAID